MGKQDLERQGSQERHKGQIGQSTGVPSGSQKKFSVQKLTNSRCGAGEDC